MERLRRIDSALNEAVNLLDELGTADRPPDELDRVIAMVEACRLVVQQWITTVEREFEERT